MNTRIKLLVKAFSLSIALSSLVLGGYAKSNYSKLLAPNLKTSKIKKMTKSITGLELKSSTNNKDIVFEKDKNIEDWMLEITIKHNNTEEKRHLEEWMFDEYFWKIVEPEQGEGPVEEPYEIEDWMLDLNIQHVGCIDIYSGFKEKAWMKHHSFFIL